MNKLAICLFCAFSLFILWIIYLANTGQNSIFFDFVRTIPYGDKVGHFCLFGVLTLLANFAIKFKVIRLNMFELYWGSLAVFIFVTCEELSQHFMPNRTLDILDYTANIAGILVFSWLSSLLAKQLTKNTQHKV